MKKLLASVLCLFAAVAFMAIAPSTKAADKPRCVTPTQTEFLEQNKDHILKLHVVPDGELQIFLTEINAKRAVAKMHPLEADIMLLAELKAGMFGIAMFKDTCIVPGSVIAGPMGKMFMFLKELKSEHILSVTGGAV